MSSGPSHLVRILLPQELATGGRSVRTGSSGFLEELAMFGGATSFIRASG